MKNKIAIVSLLVLACGMSFGQKRAVEPPAGLTGSDYPITPIPFTQVEVTDQFWNPRIALNHEVTIPHALNMCDSRIMNFKIAAGLEEGHFQTSLPFDDSEVYKVIQGASYALQYYDDPELDKQLDSLISIIALAQEDDGYIYTIRTIDGDNAHPWIGDDRWVLVHDLSHELYNIGHLLEAASAHYVATGKTNFLDVAIKAADCVDNAFGWGKIENYPGHQEIEKGLVELYRVTGETRYLNLAKFFLDVRGGGPEYCQAHLPVTEQTEAVGHSVRAVYMYAGMADIAAIMGETSYINAIDQIWEDIVSKKIYVTGGIGASGGNEGFDEPYNLPNSSAYCETCASIGNIYLNYRLFLLHGQAKYIDLLERSLYNAMLSGISYSGDRFFYPNRLETSGAERSAWFECSCCPSNVTRIIPSVPGYIYATREDSLYVNLFMTNEGRIKVGDDTVHVQQHTNYPWSGDIAISVALESPKTFTMLVRKPGWANEEVLPGDLYTFSDSLEQTYTLQVNGVSFDAPEHDGYLVLTREWSDGDSISYELPFEVRKIVANEAILADRGRIALQQGPLVFCSEFVDNPDIDVLYQRYDSAMLVESGFHPDLFFGTNVLTSTVVNDDVEQEVSFIPYHLWANRGTGPMQVWLSVKPLRVLPDSLIIIDEDAGDFATTNYVSTWEDLTGIYDLYDPQSSADKGPAAFGNWAASGETVGQWNWVQFNLHKVYNITASDVYWWDDNQGITLPDSYYLAYYDAGTDDFVEVPGSMKYLSRGEIEWDKYNTTDFETVTTNQMRLYFKGDTRAQGILEWMIYGEEADAIQAQQDDRGEGFELFPVPAEEKVSIRLHNKGEANLKVFALNGKLVYEHHFDSEMVLRRTDLADKGNCYIVTLDSGGASFSRKLLFSN
ncbi:MAG: glycoside hydrolase family 127 protein [Bacteroidales bacterium]|nr:glycoside hydrolase family 127 protein [Bacteroidales bacterium]